MLTTAICFAALLPGISLAQAQPEPAPAATPAPVAMDRLYEQIILTGKILPSFTGVSVKSFRAGSINPATGELRPIPVQADERNEKNNSFVFALGPGADVDSTPGVFDSNDEIVFLARDLGPRASDDQRRALGSEVIEVKVTDPGNSATGFAYLFKNPDALPLSKIDYVNLDDPQTGLRVASRSYGFGLADQCQLTFDYLSVREPGQQSEVNIMDRLKVRGWVKLFGFISLSTDECSWTSRYHGAVDGPVRVIRRTKSSFTVAMIPSVRFDTELVFYPDHFEVAITGRLPFDLETIAPTGGFAVYADYNDAVKGAKFYTGSYTAGITFDGTPKAEPSYEVLSRIPYVWGAVYGLGPKKNLGWFSRVVPGYNVPQKYAPQVFDNDRQNNPPEKFPGVHEIGFKVDSLNELKGGRFAISSVAYRIQDWDPRDAQKLLNVVDSPLSAELAPADGTGAATRFAMPTRPNEPPVPQDVPASGTIPARKK